MLIRALEKPQHCFEAAQVFAVTPDSCLEAIVDDKRGWGPTVPPRDLQVLRDRKA